ncbi:tyrosine protein kinase Blk [Echinococcus multilocularis]|uniref:Tyrosine-protein kinase n=1 Tax=Echinococcus multilocularis TaxID=6211 RepID=A0A068Y5H1_ECHMU|nr:tyrosine protein kinase Blk [Echinococcus multilocularis]
MFLKVIELRRDFNNHQKCFITEVFISCVNKKKAKMYLCKLIHRKHSNAFCECTTTQSATPSFIVGDLLSVVETSHKRRIAPNLPTVRKDLIPFSHVTTNKSLSEVSKAWFDIDRISAERKLLMPGVKPGTYILRPCGSNDNPYSLSVRANGVKIKHFRVYFDEKTRSFCLCPSIQFPSLEGMIRYYHSESIDGEVGLIEACPRRVLPPLSFEDCFIHYDDLKLEKELGRGNFGVVYLGHILSMEVAVKKSLNSENDQAFRAEAEVMHKLSHQRIVRFLGFCCDTPDKRVLIITEFMANGALLDYLRTPEGHRLEYHQLISIIDQIVKGMVYLEKVGVVHRDLRAANVLVDEDGSVKIADFGLTKILNFNQTLKKDTIPVRWTALEAMRRGYQPNTKADVWSFGVVMFEVLTYGKVPFEEYDNPKLLRFLLEGGRLSSPRIYGFECDGAVYAIMRSCWDEDPERRPSFMEISHEIEQFIKAKEGSYVACWEKMIDN